MSTPASSSNSPLGDLFQNSFYIGVNVENILYGIELFLYLETMWIFLTSGKARKKSDGFYALFSSIMLFLVTIWVASQAFFGQKMWILGVSYPGGPQQYYKENIFVWYADWGTTAVILLQLMTDGLMIYRCWIIWNSYRTIVFPSILWLISFALGTIVDWVTSLPGDDYFDDTTIQFCIAYCTVEVVLHITLTCMICYRIVQHGRKVKEQLGHQYASLYFSIVTLFVESVFPYTISGIAFVASLVIDSSTSIAFVSVYVLMMCISSQILILRVIMRRAVDNRTFKQRHSTVKFSPGSGLETAPPPLDTTETKVHRQVALSGASLGDDEV